MLRFEMHLRRLTLAAVFACAVTACGEKNDKATPDPAGTGSGSTVKPPTAFGEPALAQLTLGKLTERERKELVSSLDETSSPCADTPVPLSQCIAEKRACNLCKPAGEMMARLIRGGLPRADRAKLMELRFDPKGVATIDLKGSASKGPEDAPVTIVEWADFECPFCAMMNEMLELYMERFPGQVRVVYKYYALPNHTHALPAALACRAAQNQGKFWEMHKLLFANQEKLERADLFGYAKSVGLDMDQFQKDFADEKTAELVQKDMKAADDLKLDGTPLMYVNGRKLPGELVPAWEEVEAWLKLEIELAGKKPAEPSARFHELLKKFSEPPPSPAASGSAGPAVPPPGSGAPSAAPSAGSSASPR